MKSLTVIGRIMEKASRGGQPPAPELSMRRNHLLLASEMVLKGRLFQQSGELHCNFSVSVKRTPTSGRPGPETAVQ